MRPKPTGHFVKGSVVTPDFLVQAHGNTEILHSGRRVKHRIHATNMPVLELDLDWLAAASEVYHISPDPKDYVMVSVPLVTADIPNRNMQHFSCNELLTFCPNYGMLVYQTFNKKACFLDHKNDIPHEASGVIADTSMEYIPKYDLWKIKVLSLWDRSKNTDVVNKILNRVYSGYSMGATVAQFVCTVCGKEDTVDYRRCDHMKRIGSVWGDEKRLASQLCTGSCFFENSLITKSDPADPTAFADDILV
jgi:hypothetical protein